MRSAKQFPFPEWRIYASIFLTATGGVQENYVKPSWVNLFREIKYGKVHDDDFENVLRYALIE